MNCKVSKYLAYSMAVYSLASMYYLSRSRSVGTPFNDSLTDAQREIKLESSKVRRQIFIEGIMLSLLVLLIMNPFKSC